MADFLLHGLWVQKSGLHLWIEQVEGHRIVLPDQVPDGTFPPSVTAILERSSFRHRLRATLRTPKGREVSLVIPTSACTPEQAVQVLASMVFLDEQSPAATRAQREAIAPDLRWLIRMYAGLRRFVQAGRLTLKLAYVDDQWWPQWQLSQGLGERGWIAEMMAAAPGILSLNNRNLDEDITEVLPHWIASAELADLRDTPRPHPWHDFSTALLHNQPLRRGGVGLLNRLREWKESIAAVDLQLVIIVEQPPSGDSEVTADPEAAVWPVRFQVRSGVESPIPLRENRLDRGSVMQLDQARQRARKISTLLGGVAREDAPEGLSTPPAPPQQSSLRDAALGGASISESPLPAYTGPLSRVDSAGDWDVYLTTGQIVHFIAHDVPLLKRAGFTVMLPKAWASYDTKATLVTSEGEGATQRHIGMDKVVDYNWKLSVGDTELTDAEMAELVRSKSGLIRLRGEWVLADTSSLSKITAYMEELAQNSRKRSKARLEEAAMRAELARVNNEPGWESLAAEAERLREEFNRDQEHRGQVSVAELRQIALEAMSAESAAPVEFTGSTWYSSLLGGTDTPAPEWVEIPETVQAELREYQRRGVDWLYWMSRNDLGAVLADDMGLGKTLQLLTLLAVEHHRGENTGPTLVVAPTSVVGNWAREARRFVPHLRVLVHHGNTRLRGERFQREVARTDLVISSYGVLNRDHAQCAEVQWDHVVLDEAQHIKNSATRSSKAARSLPARQRIALTGTPVENRLSEMRSILDFVNPGVLGSASFFRNHFAKAIEREQDEQMTERLRLLTAPFIMRRLKTDPNIIDDLPEKSEQVRTVTMTSEQAALYTAYVEDMKRKLIEVEGIARRGLVLASLTRIKQICNHPAHFLGDGSGVTLRGAHRSGKVAELVELLDESLTAGNRVLIFTQYRAFGEILQPYLSERLGERIDFLHGGISQAARDRMVERFQDPQGPPAMLLSLKAGGTGLNLTGASVVVHMDRWWNPAVENQATDRAFRIGQNKNVQVYKMITAGTMEESIQDILDGKTHLAGAVVGEGEGWITELSPEDLAHLMSYRGREASQ
ncbi:MULTISPECIES: DEAD/DEAH box helicase [unclassified Corynebacterium]|uniref:DEAD/DEAH box helicase n=1 Tax=unclassified Corynebacterium TaxID=2624378 RepID=UPI0029CA6342|nr:MULTISPECIES: DEAD/DEAH box helicase [unclassified Corynebacterium]WPF66991.1 DEAD/DEAH box helicase [Corynebacterium sp. 22KM0430]WPF69479.1 DEAD/DEAH box helicase [Corynebacterium sp. 21KM1197]